MMFCKNAAELKAVKITLSFGIVSQYRAAFSRTAAQLCFRSPSKHSFSIPLIHDVGRSQINAHLQNSQQHCPARRHSRTFIFVLRSLPGTTFYNTLIGLKSTYCFPSSLKYKIWFQCGPLKHALLLKKVFCYWWNLSEFYATHLLVYWTRTWSFVLS